MLTQPRPGDDNLSRWRAREKMFGAQKTRLSPSQLFSSDLPAHRQPQTIHKWMGVAGTPKIFIYKNRQWVDLALWFSTDVSLWKFPFLDGLGPTGHLSDIDPGHPEWHQWISAIFVVPRSLTYLGAFPVSVNRFFISQDAKSPWEVWWVKCDCNFLCHHHGLLLLNLSWPCDHFSQ